MKMGSIDTGVTNPVLVESVRPIMGEEPRRNSYRDRAYQQVTYS